MKYQLSTAFPLWRGIAGDSSVLGASYTQRSRWQLSNRGESSPFRETNYEPQLFVGWATDYRFAGWTLRDVEIGVNHQSNGRSDPTSRSWNRGYARLMAQNGNWQVIQAPVPFLGELEQRRQPGHHQIHGILPAEGRLRPGDSVFSVDSHYNWNSGYGGAELGWSYPITRNVRFYTRVFSGYGESLIDYNFRQTRVGVGVMLNDIM